MFNARCSPGKNLLSIFNVFIDMACRGYRKLASIKTDPFKYARKRENKNSAGYAPQTPAQISQTLLNRNSS